MENFGLDVPAKPKKKHEMRKRNTTNNFIMSFRPAVLDNAGLSFDNEQQEEEERSGFVVEKVDVSSSSRRFSRAWKAVLEASMPSRRIRKWKSKKSPRSSSSAESGRSNYQETSKNLDQLDDEQCIISRSISALATPSSTSSAFDSLCSKCLSSVSKTSPIERGYYESNCGLFLMLITLLVLVFWGRVCAIFCTSTWLFLMPRWTRVVDEPSPEPKRKIVTEGSVAMRRRSFRCQ